MRVRVSLVQYFEIQYTDPPNGGDVTPTEMLDDVLESWMNHILDQQDNEDETTDGKFNYVPCELEAFKVEPG